MQANIPRDGTTAQQEMIQSMRVMLWVFLILGALIFSGYAGILLLALCRCKVCCDWFKYWRRATAFGMFDNEAHILPAGDAGYSLTWNEESASSAENTQGSVLYTRSQQFDRALIAVYLDVLSATAKTQMEQIVWHGPRSTRGFVFVFICLVTYCAYLVFFIYNIWRMPSFISSITALVAIVFAFIVVYAMVRLYCEWFSQRMLITSSRIIVYSQRLPYHYVIDYCFLDELSSVRESEDGKSIELVYENYTRENIKAPLYYQYQQQEMINMIGRLRAIDRGDNTLYEATLVQLE